MATTTTTTGMKDCSTKDLTMMRGGAKIESPLVPRAFLLLALMTLSNAACMPRRSAAVANAKANASTKVVTAQPDDVRAGTLPQTRLPREAPTTTAPAGLAREEKVAGLYTDSFEGQPKLTGIKEREKALAALGEYPEDPPSDSYCLETKAVNRVRPLNRPLNGPPLDKEEVKDKEQAWLLNYFGDAYQPVGRVHAERLEKDGQLTVLSAWAEHDGGVRQVTKSSVPTKLIGFYEGVSVFAFVDQGSPGSPNTGSHVNIIVKRPELKKRRLRGHAIVMALPDGTFGQAACTHARVSLPIVKGDGATVSFMVGVETEKGARAMRVHAGTLWLGSEQDARVSARLEWDGVETNDTANLLTAGMERRSFGRRGSGEGF